MAQLIHFLVEHLVLLLAIFTVGYLISVAFCVAAFVLLRAGLEWLAGTSGEDRH